MIVSANINKLKDSFQHVVVITTEYTSSFIFRGLNASVMARCWGSHTHSFRNHTTKDSQHLGKCRPCWLCYLHSTQRDAEKGWTGGRSAERGCPKGVHVGKVQRAFLLQHKQEIPAQRSHWAKPWVMRVLHFSDGENTNESTCCSFPLWLSWIQRRSDIPEEFYLSEALLFISVVLAQLGQDSRKYMNRFFFFSQSFAMEMSCD